MAARRLLIRDVQIVMPDHTAWGHVHVEDDLIHSILSDAELDDSQFAAAEIIDGQGMLLLPGMIDLHCDAIEKEVEPRPNTFIPLSLAFKELEKKIAAAGVTMMFHSLSIGTGLSLRGDALMQEMVNIIHHYKQQAALIRHRVHVRYELTHLSGIHVAEQLVRAGKVDYFSIMKHVPGSGQYKHPGSFEAYVMKNQGVSEEEVQDIVSEVMAKEAHINWDDVRRLTDLVLSQSLRIASHDDDHPAHVEAAIRLGASVSEFPLNLETAHYAREHNIDVCVGAPNIIRGRSHEHHLSASEAISAGAANIICSDYAPSLLLPAVFKLVSEHDIALSAAVNMVSLNPAKALGIDRHYGSIEAGKKADLLLVEQRDRYPSLRLAIVNGQSVYAAQQFAP